MTFVRMRIALLPRKQSAYNHRIVLGYSSEGHGPAENDLWRSRNGRRCIWRRMKTTRSVCHRKAMWSLFWKLIRRI